MIPIISPEQLKSLNEECDNLLVQISTDSSSGRGDAIQAQLSYLHTEQIIPAKEGCSQVTNYFKLAKMKENPSFGTELFDFMEKSKGSIPFRDAEFYSMLSSNRDLPIIVCMLGKTGDITMIRTLTNFSLILQTHCPYLLHKDYTKGRKIKIITAVREPIIRDLSHLYQFISNFDGYHGFFNQEDGFTQEVIDLYSSNDAQLYFDKFVQVYENSRTNKWFSSFKDSTVDLLKYPFDTEKGYTIVQEDNYDIFVYQLEKLNNLLPELSNWLGYPLEKLVNANLASDKWIGESYKQAQKELQITQEYFDQCYDDPYIKHFYSEEDISKFKARWAPHIKK